MIMSDNLKIAFLVFCALVFTSVRPAYAALVYSAWAPSDPVTYCPAAFTATGNSAYGWAYHHTSNFGVGTNQEGGNCFAICSNSGLCGAQYNVVSSFDSSPRRTLSCDGVGEVLGGTYPNKTCATACPAVGTSYSSGWYDVGVDPSIINGIPNGSINSCSGGCGQQYEGSSISKRSLVGGVYHYYSQGSYVSTGSTCSSGPASPGAVASVPPDACAAGQSFLIMNGRLACFNSSGERVNSDGVTGIPAVPTSVSAQEAGIAAAAAASAAGADAATAAAAGQSAAASVIASNAVGDSLDISTLATHSDISGQTASLNSKLDELKTPWTDLPSVLGTPGAPDLIPSEIYTPSVSVISFAAPAGCPAPLLYSMFGVNYSLTFDAACDLMTSIRPVVLSIAAATAAIIFMGVF